VGAVTPYKFTKYHKDRLADYPAKKRCNLGSPCVASAQLPWLEQKELFKKCVCTQDVKCNVIRAHCVIELLILWP
jgi:hypothetical protein